MTVTRLRETRSLMGASPNGYGWSDPAAIPPPGMYQQQRAGVAVTAHTSLQVDVVYTALRVISNAIIKLGDLRAFTWAYDKDNLPYQKYLAAQPALLTDTFGGLFQYDGRRRTVLSLGLFGEAFWYVLTRDRLDYATALEVLHPAFMEIKPDSSGNPIYLYGTGSNRKTLDPANVVHIPFMSMPGAKRGLSSIEYAGVSYALALAAMEYGQRWFSQGASPSFLLSTDQKLGREEVERIAEKFLIEHSGLQSAHLPLVLDSGLKAAKISSTPDEAQYLNTLNWARSTIAAWFGLPAHLVGAEGDRGNVWGKTVEEQSFQMVDYTLSGYIIPLAEAHSRLLPAGVFAAFDDSLLLRANSADTAAEILALRQTQAASVNDIRVRKLRWQPVDGGDEVIAPLASNTAPEQTQEIAQKAEQEDDQGDNQQNAAHLALEQRYQASLDEQRELLKALASRDVKVTVEPTTVTVEPTNVTVDFPPISVDPPTVNVEAPNISVQPAEVRVEPNIIVNVPDTKTTTKILRDATGRATGLEQK